MKINYLTRLFLLVIITIIVSSCSQNEHKHDQTEEQEAKYIFYFIGDGMSNQHINLTEAYLKDANTDEIGFQKLAFDTLPFLGMITTYANNSLITGSAAAGTAMATGNKTNLKRISMSPDGKEKYESIAYKLKNQDKKIGIISTVSIDHATPAVFYANQEHRKQYFEIGKQLSESGFDFFGGGGFVEPEKDSINLYSYTEKNNYHLLKNLDSIDQIKDNKPVMFVNPVLGKNGEMPYAIDRMYEGGYSLAEITRAAIDHLYNDKGFFIMIESGKIDWASHINDAATIVSEIIDFDKSVQEALRFYKKHPDETLIVVTADHETGGLSLGTASPAKAMNYKSLNNQKMSYERAEKLMKNGDISKEQLSEIFYISDLNKWEKSVLKRSENAINNPDYSIDYGSYNPIIVSYLKIINARAGIDFSTWGHTSAEVPVFSIGKGSEMFKGKYDNTDLPQKIMKAVGE